MVQETSEHVILSPLVKPFITRKLSDRNSFREVEKLLHFSLSLTNFIEHHLEEMLFQRSELHSVDQVTLDYIQKGKAAMTNRGEETLRIESATLLGALEMIKRN